jgi:multiple sugar transport system substrate-binding protein
MQHPSFEQKQGEGKMTPQKRSSLGLTRREMLKLSAAMAAGGLLAACGAQPTPEPTEAPAAALTEAPTEAPTSAPPPAAAGHVVLMHQRNEFSEEEEAQFLTENPGITLELVDADIQRFQTMYAAGNPPDLMRTQAPAVPQYLARKMMYDLTPYFETSTVLKIDDLAPANQYYMANAPTEIGAGKIYGMCKDWSPDLTLWAFTTAFEEAGVEVPQDMAVLTYPQVADLAEKLSVFEGDRVARWGFGYNEPWIDRTWMNILAETGRSLYAEDFASINLTGNDDTKEIVKWYYDLAAANYVANPVNPTSSWAGDDFVRGVVAMVQYGYWFGGMAESDVTAGKVIMLASPTWSGERRDPTITATGMFMAAATQVPDAAWKLFEYYNSGQPAINRAGSGWGVPALKSMYDLMPKETDFDQQRQRVLKAELDLATPPLQFNPFITETAVYDTWTVYLEQALNGAMTFDELLANVEADVNTAIQEGKERIG